MFALSLSLSLSLLLIHSLLHPYTHTLSLSIKLSYIPFFIFLACPARCQSFGLSLCLLLKLSTVISSLSTFFLSALPFDVSPSTCTSLSTNWSCSFVKLLLHVAKYQVSSYGSFPASKLSIYYVLRVYVSTSLFLLLSTYKCLILSTNTYYVCIFLSTYVCLYLSTYVCFFLSTYVCLFLSTYVCLFLSTYVCLFLSTYL